jgi:hypothetical protein
VYRLLPVTRCSAPRKAVYPAMCDFNRVKKRGFGVLNGDSEGLSFGGRRQLAARSVRVQGPDEFQSAGDLAIL